MCGDRDGERLNGGGLFCRGRHAGAIADLGDLIEGRLPVCRERDVFLDACSLVPYRVSCPVAIFCASAASSEWSRIIVFSAHAQSAEVQSVSGVGDGVIKVIGAVFGVAAGAGAGVA